MDIFPNLRLHLVEILISLLSKESRKIDSQNGTEILNQPVLFMLPHTDQKSNLDCINKGILE